MGKLLWKPADETVRRANIAHFMQFVNGRYKKNFSSYWELYDWSVENISEFWVAVWEFTDVKASKPYENAVEDLTVFPGAKWFPGARLNHAENLLRYRDEQPAFIFRNETGRRVVMSYGELYSQVARLAASLRKIGMQKGDRVAGYMPNVIETAVAMLAANSIGAIWSSCATDIGPDAVIDRFGQIEPKVLFTVDGYFYKGKPFDSLANVKKIVAGIPSLKKVVITCYKEEKPEISSIPNSVYFHEFLAPEDVPENKTEITFEQSGFDHPIFIMFSSGTTGKPKCIVQGAGVLINHLKELVIHTDLRRDDVHFFITTCSWMMWNWVMSSLATGNTIVLYDGNPNFPDYRAMWKVIEEEKVTMFGCSATYINYLKSQNFIPKNEFKLSPLREIWQTGSVLSVEGFEYVYEAIKQDVHVNSSSGGTDINGCFYTGSPVIPVYAGELQSPALAMKVKSYDEKGNPVVNAQGELVCEMPSPSMPLCFWDDEGDKKYKEAYFGYFPGKNVWRHGDYVIVHGKTRGATFYGRSDSVLKPSGVRIGTAEIYNVVESLEEVADSVVIGQNIKDDQRVLLFVKLADGVTLTDELQAKIKAALKKNASPRHVPDKIFQVPEIPYTMNMKKVESAVTNIINGRPVTNRDALMNPKSLDVYEKILCELRE